MCQDKQGHNDTSVQPQTSQWGRLGENHGEREYESIIGVLAFMMLDKQVD